MKQCTLKVYSRSARLPFLISALSFLYLLKLSWLKWGDLIVDVGREMYVPFELSAGKLLYRDVSYLYGPFSPYFNAALFKILGTHLRSLIASGIISVILTCLIIYKIARTFLDRFLSTFAVLTFLFVFAFGQYVYFGNYNFILPYSYPAIHGILFSLAALYFFYRSLFKIPRYMPICPAFVALTFLCRIEIAFMLTLSIALALVIYGLSGRRPSGEMLRNFLIYVVLPVTCAVLIYALFFISSSGIIQKSNLFDIWLKNINTDSPFVQRLSGISDIAGNTLIMLKVFLYYLALYIFFGIAGLSMEYFYRRNSRFKKAALSLTAGFIYLGLSFVFFKKFFSYDLQYRCLPLICLLAILISLWKYIKMKEKAEYLFMLTLSAFSLFLASRMLFSVWAGHYGFYLLVPGMLIYYIFFFKIVAAGINPALGRRFFKLGFLWISILFIISHFNISKFCYLQRTLKVSSARGNLYVFNNERERRCKELIEFLNTQTGKGESLVVFPEGLTINFLSGRENPLYYYIYLPMDLAKPGVSESIISQMKDKHVDYVALLQRDTTEYGYAVFGRDYGERIWEYILENYTLHKQFGPFPFTTQDFGIALFRRKV